eukprot:2549213-Rhodomonas_salina.4
MPVPSRTEQPMDTMSVPRAGPSRELPPPHQPPHPCQPSSRPPPAARAAATLAPLAPAAPPTASVTARGVADMWCVSHDITMAYA